MATTISKRHIEECYNDTFIHLLIENEVTDTHHIIDSKVSIIFPADEIHGQLIPPKCIEHLVNFHFSEYEWETLMKDSIPDWLSYAFLIMYFVDTIGTWVLDNLTIHPTSLLRNSWE